MPSKQQGSIYEHCIKAIEKSLNFGENGLPKIGSGDWNDGMSTVGNKGKGESVWLGFFLYDILSKFIPIMEERKQRSEVGDGSWKLEVGSWNTSSQAIVDNFKTDVGEIINRPPFEETTINGKNFEIIVGASMARPPFGETTKNRQ